MLISTDRKEESYAQRGFCVSKIRSYNDKQRACESVRQPADHLHNVRAMLLYRNRYNKINLLINCIEMKNHERFAACPEYDRRAIRVLIRVYSLL